MGAGKSTVGPHVARALGYFFVDADEEIQRRSRRTIPDLFRVEGEAFFRELEARIVQELTDRSQMVVALGGGAILNPESRQRLLGTGSLVYLRAKWETLLRRLELTSRTSNPRPLLGPWVDPSVRSSVNSLLLERLPLYEVCTLSVDTDERSVEDVVREIVEFHENSHA